MKNLRVVPIDMIQADDRFRKDLGDIDELCNSIEYSGLLMPIAVRENEDDSFTLIAGGRRVNAFLKLQEKYPDDPRWQNISAKIFPSSLSDIQLREAELAENMIRKDMTWAEEVALKQQIHKMMIDRHGKRIGKTEDAKGWDSMQTAKILNTSSSSISRDLKLADALDRFPDLSKAKNKTEAIKILDKARTFHSDSQIEARLKDISGDKNKELYLKKKLCDSFVLGDAFLKMEKLPDDYFDLIEVDPPYGIDFQNQKRKPGRMLESVSYNEIKAEDYPEFLEKILNLCFKKVKANGWVVFWHSIYPWYPVVSDMAKGVGFLSANFPAMWVKTAASNQNPVYNLARNYENFLYLRRGPAKLNRMGSLSTFITEPLRGERIHPTERPIHLMEQILNTFLLPGSGRNVLVPFAGSGNTLLAACNQGHTAMGYDLSPEYRNGFLNRVMNGEYAKYSSRKDEKPKTA